MRYVNIMDELQSELVKWSGNLAELAELSGVSIHTIYKLATGYNNNPTVETAQKLIDVFTSNKR